MLFFSYSKKELDTFPPHEISPFCLWLVFATRMRLGCHTRLIFDWLIFILQSVANKGSVQFCVLFQTFRFFPEKDSISHPRSINGSIIAADVETGVALSSTCGRQRAGTVKMCWRGDLSTLVLPGLTTGELWGVTCVMGKCQTCCGWLD